MSTSHHIDDYCDTAEAATVLGLSTETVKKYCQRRKLLSRKFGSSWLVLRADISRYQAERRPVGRPISTGK